MDPSTDPPATTEPAAHIAHAANPTPSHGPNHNHNHPPYAEMITAAITALKEKNGSSRRAIAKYIDKAYSNLPPSHSALLTHHLKRLKNGGQLVMVKHSYKLARSVPLASGPGNVSSSGSKRSPGRPPKPKPVTEPVVENGPGPGTESVFVSLGLVDVPTTEATRGPGRPPKPKTGTVSVGPMTVKRGRGRPPGLKPLSLVMASDRPKRGRGRPPRTGLKSVSGSAGVPRPRGRPKKGASSAAKVSGRPRGRPRKSISAVVADGGSGSGALVLVGGSDGVLPVPVGGGDGVLPVSVAGGDGILPAKLPVKRRGRPPKSVEAKKMKPRKFSGRPLGRPRKNASIGIEVSGQQQQQVTYEDLMSKLEHFQSRIKQAVGVVKPQLNAETAVSALGALQELEELATMDVSAPLNVHVQVQEPLLQN